MIKKSPPPKKECKCSEISWDEDDFYGSCKKCGQVYQRGREVEDDY